MLRYFILAVCFGFSFVGCLIATAQERVGDSLGYGVATVLTLIGLLLCIDYDDRRTPPCA